MSSRDKYFLPVDDPAVALVFGKSGQGAQNIRPAARLGQCHAGFDCLRHKEDIFLLLCQFSNEANTESAVVPTAKATDMDNLQICSKPTMTSVIPRPCPHIQPAPLRKTF